VSGLLLPARKFRISCSSFIVSFGIPHHATSACHKNSEFTLVLDIRARKFLPLSGILKEEASIPPMNGASCACQVRMQSGTGQTQSPEDEEEERQSGGSVKAGRPWRWSGAREIRHR
jgi:hypothetical protein